MTIQTALIILLVGLVVLLAVLLSARIRSERKHSAAIRRMNLAEFSEFLRTNSSDGSVQLVAGKVSDLLKQAFGCERIVFLRKRRRYLELNYFHGINRFNRRDFRALYNGPLTETLRDQVYPQPVATIAEHLPSLLREQLDRFDMDLCFPIVWRDHLYGIYFIRSTIETKAPSFQLLIASLAQSLSAAYHIKWHEDTSFRLREELRTTAAKDSDGPGENNNTPHGILKLVRHHDSETLVGRIMEAVQSDLKLERMAYVYESQRETEPLRLLKDGVHGRLTLPPQQAFREIVAALDTDSVAPVSKLTGAGHGTAAWSKQLTEAGLQYVISFPLTEKRSGVLAWQDGKSPEQVINRLKAYGVSAAELVENAESFEHVMALSFKDNLTGLANQRYFVKRLDEEIGRADRYDRSMALIIFDLDELKSINDTYGHQAGDAVITQMGQLLQGSIRSMDVVARYGGDEFCVIMPEADAATCLAFMNRLHDEIAERVFTIAKPPSEIHCTISQGAAVFPRHARSAEQLIYAADMALLRAKDAGRNHFFLYQ
ncbi:MAG: GGDEF domain-containing protein [candidate division Zixibacteria bacterium]|nr:GGDEF domain-containing protein [candidate division Zixibacteria bacterium]